MSDARPSAPLGFPAGTWADTSAESSVRFTIGWNEGEASIAGLDTDDGEALEISNVRWDGLVLAFVSRTPSTGYVVELAIRVLGFGEVELATTRRMRWRRLPFS